VMQSWEVDATAAYHAPLFSPGSWVVYLLVAEGGMKSYVGWTKDIEHRLRAHNDRSPEGNDRFWRVAAVISSFSSEEDAHSVVTAWRGMRKMPLSGEYAPGEYFPPPGSLWSQVPAVLRRTQQLAALSVPDALLSLAQAQVHWTPDDVLLERSKAEARAEGEESVSSIAAALGSLAQNQEGMALLPEREELGLGPRAYSSFCSFFDLLARLRALHLTRSLAHTLHDLVDSIGYKEHLHKLSKQVSKKKSQQGSFDEDEDEEDEEGAEANETSRWEIVETLISIAEEMGQVNQEEQFEDPLNDLQMEQPFGIQEYLDHVALASSSGEDNQDAVKLMTIHSSKGLEFDTVYIVGCHDGRIPLIYQRGEQDEVKLAEEQRLFYVAITRASSELFISYSTYTTHPSFKCSPSRFLKPLGNVLIPGRDFNEETPEMERLRSQGWQLMQTWL